MIARTARLLIVIVVLSWSGAAASAPALVLDAGGGDAGGLALAGHLELLRDPDAGMSIAEAVRADGFVPLAGSLSAGYDRGTAFWLRFTVERNNEAPREWWLEVTPAFLDMVTLFEPAGDGTFVTRAAGDRQPFARRDVAHRNVVFPIQLTTTAATFYVRVQTTSTAAVRLTLWQPRMFAEHTALEYGLYGIYFGVTAVIAIFNLIFWLWLRERSYLSYTVYLVSLAFAVLTSQGFANQYLFPQSPLVADQMVGVTVTLAFAIGVWFFRTVMDLRRHFPRLHRVIGGAIAFFAAACAAAVAGYYPQIAPAVQLMGLVITLTFLVVGFMLLRRGHRELLLYQIAFSVHYAGVIVNAARNLGLLTPGIVADNAVLIGSALHMVLLNIALANRIRDAERAKYDAERRARDAAHEAEHVLEVRVAERTDELARANDALQKEIDERRALQEQLQVALTVERNAQAMQRQFVATVSHEFRTPLAVIDATAQTLAFQLSEDVLPDAPRRIDKIRRAVARLTTLIENCLSDERLALGGAPLRREDVDLCRLVGTLADEWRANAAVPLRLALPADGASAVVACDKALISIALSNLIDNAIKYSPAGGEIVLALERAGDGIRLSVADCGTGIAAEDLARVFEKFYRTQAAASTSGAGLGLYLVQQIARRHGGDVEAVSTLGQGSTFRILLPSQRA